MAAGRSVTRRTQMAATLAGLACLVASLSAMSGPAGAADIAVGSASSTPVTWVDPQGRQYVVTQVAATFVGVVVARDLVSGRPDPAWTAPGNAVGQRTITFTPPAPGVNLSGQFAVSPGGVLSTTWSAPSCSAAAACDRWFATYDGAAGGDPLVAPTLVADTPPILRNLRDGSFLTGPGSGPDGPLGWRGPDGTGRGAPAVSAQSVLGGDVDAHGALLVSTTAGRIRRWPAGGPETLDASVPCADPTSGLAVGGAPGGGWAVACRNGDPSAVTISRFGADDQLIWQSNGNDPIHPISRPSLLTVDDTDRVWVTSNGTTIPFLGASTPTVIASFTHLGPSSIGYVRASSSGSTSDLGGGGITELRPLADGHVAFADQEVCCFYAISGGHTSPASSAHGQVLPNRPGPPTCSVTGQQLTEADDTSFTMSFLPCGATRANEVPTGYRVATTGPAGTGTVTVPATGPYLAPFTGLHGARRASVTVTPVDDVGDSTSPPSHLVTVLPFCDEGQFIDRMGQQLVGANPSQATEVELAAALADPEAPDDEPAVIAASMLDTGLAHTQVEPIARLYRAYFRRDPDVGGLGYWIRRHRTGTSLRRISATFAASREFATAYGTLSNAGFVAKLYVNVFGRTGDPDGLAFWTKRLDEHRADRGQVVLQFAESSEGVRRAAPTVEPLAVAYLLLGRRPTALEQATWGTFASRHREVADAILASHEYATTQTPGCAPRPTN